jgi:hypothetical protein
LLALIQFYAFSRPPLPQVINAWQAENKLSLEEARAKFPNCRFSGS